MWQIMVVLLVPAFAWMGALQKLLAVAFISNQELLLLVIFMLVAIFMQQIQNGLWNCLCCHGIFWVAMFFLILGSGRFGIDYLLTRKIKL
jgi:putative oxidoreductase